MSVIESPPYELDTSDPEVERAVGIRDRLLKALDERCRVVRVLENYYDGNHPVPKCPDRMREHDEAKRAFENLSKLGVTNYMPPIADQPARRLKVTGFRFGEPENLQADAEAWRIWQRNHQDADSALVYHGALVTGQAFKLVWPDNNGLAEITVEHPSQTIVAYVAGSRRNRAAGLKYWCEDDGTKRVVLYLPDNVYKWWTRTENSPLEDWQPSTDDTWPITNPLGVVPLVEYRANPSLRPAPFGGGTSEFACVLTDQDRINKTVFDRLVTAEFQAFRQRWAVGWTPDSPAEAVKMGLSTLASFEDDNVKLGEFAQADFTPFLSSVAADVEAIGARTSTPFYSLGKLANPPSGDALLALQSGLIAKTEDHRDNFTESDEEAIALALMVEGNPRASDVQSQVQWRSVAFVTFAEKSDAAVKYLAAGVPEEVVWQDVLGFTPQDVTRFKVMNADKALFAPANGTQ